MSCSVPAGRRAVGRGRARGGAADAALRAGRAAAPHAAAGRALAAPPGARAPHHTAARRQTDRARYATLPSHYFHYFKVQ